MKSTGRVTKNDLGDYDVNYGGINGCNYAEYTEFREGTRCSHWFSNAIYRCTHTIEMLWTKMFR